MVMHLLLFEIDHPAQTLVTRGARGLRLPSLGLICWNLVPSCSGLAGEASIVFYSSQVLLAGLASPLNLRLLCGISRPMTPIELAIS